MPRKPVKHTMSPRRCRWIAACFIAAALACIITWAALRNRNAWSNPAGTWPRYVDVDKGLLMLMSSMWKPSPEGNFAWQLPVWMYDAFGAQYPTWRPAYTKIGNAYGTAPGQYTTSLHALTIPIWWFAFPLAAAAAAYERKARNAKQAGMCERCGYALTGIDPKAPCPECGRTRAS